MKKLFIVIMVLMLSVAASAEFTEAKYQVLVDTNKRIPAYKEIVGLLKKSLDAIEAKKFYDIIKDTPTTIDVDQDTIDEMAALYNALKNGSANMRSTYRVLLTGDDGVE